MLTANRKRRQTTGARDTVLKRVTRSTSNRLSEPNSKETVVIDSDSESETIVNNTKIGEASEDVDIESTVVNSNSKREAIENGAKSDEASEVIDSEFIATDSNSTELNDSSPLESVENLENLTETADNDNESPSEKLDAEPEPFVGKPKEPVNFRFTAARRVGQQVLYSIDEKQKYKVNQRNKGEEEDKRDEYTCCVSRCPARIWHYTSGRCIFSPNFKPHNHASDAEKVIKIDAVMKKNKDDAAKLVMSNGRIQPLEEIFRKNANG